MARDLYSILGVPKNANEDAIKKAFRKLAVQYHPDRAPGKASEDKFKEINRAHEVLGDPKKRALYDEFGEDSLQQGFDPERARMLRNFGGRRGGGGRGGAQGFQDVFVGGGDFGDVFGDFFGRGGGRARPAKAPDMEANVTIDFLAALRGTTVKLSRGGTSEPLVVRIPAGAADGSRLKVEGQGAQVAGALPGDLHLAIHVTPHPFLRREGDDLHMDVPLTIAEAYEGAKIRVPTLDGDVTLKVPPRTQSGQVLRLKGKGIAKKGGVASDLYAHFLVKVPDHDHADVAKAIDLLRAHQGDPREALTIPSAS
ncbi:MAG: DnaJ C-terminal domain-containing protein [Polyangiaceae bacterium]